MNRNNWQHLVSEQFGGGGTGGGDDRDVTPPGQGRVFFTYTTFDGDVEVNLETGVVTAGGEEGKLPILTQDGKPIGIDTTGFRVDGYTFQVRPYNDITTGRRVYGKNFIFVEHDETDEVKELKILTGWTPDLEAKTTDMQGLLTLMYGIFSDIFDGGPVEQVIDDTPLGDVDLGGDIGPP